MNQSDNNRFAMKSLLKGLVFTLAATPLLATANLAPTDTQKQVAIDILESLSAHHYRKRPLDDQFSSELFDAYLTALDPYKSYFLNSDVKQLKRFQFELDDALKRGDLDFGFEVFNQYQQLALEQLNRNIELLESDYQFNFDDNEYLVVDPDLRNWADTAEERENLWRKRMEDALLRLKLSEKPIDEARELLVKRYKSQIKQIKETEARDVFQIYSNTFTTLYDPHSNYMSPRTSKNFEINMSLSLEGIGAVLQREDEYVKVVRVVPGGPADKQGQLKAGDRIVGVAQGDEGENVDVIGWRLDDAVELIRGPKASTVILQVLSSSAESTGMSETIRIVRDTVKLEEQAAQSQVIEVSENNKTFRIGVIELPTFYLDMDAYRNRDPNARSSTRDVYKLLKKLDSEKVDGVILDLRSNGGGSLQEATQLSDLFINPGPVVQIRNSKNKVGHQRARQGTYYRGPLLVLIDRLSASASEIFAGVIQDYGRGLVVGTQSYGKGTVQVLLPMREGSLKLTESKYYRVSGGSTQHRGIIPDISFPSDYSLETTGENKGEHSLPWDTIQAAAYRKFDNLSYVIPTLQKIHQQRTAGDPDFIHLNSRLELSENYQKQDKTRLSLNEAVRKGTRTNREERALELENQRRQTKGLEPYADVKTWKEAIESVEEDELPLGDSDPRLLEAGRILADFIELQRNERIASQQR